MATLRTKIRVAADGTITDQAAGAFPPGEYEVTITTTKQPSPRERARELFPVFHVGS